MNKKWNSFWRKFLNRFLVPIAAIAAGLTQWPDLQDDLSNWYKHLPNIIVGVYIAVNLLLHITTHTAPDVKLSEYKKNAYENFNERSKKIIQQFRPNYVIELNVMQKQLVWLGFENKRPFFFRMVFRPIEQIPRNNVPQELKLKITQGCCGEAFERKDFVEYDLDDLRNSGTDLGQKFKMDQNQLAMSQNLSMIISYPIFKVGTNKVIGILNFHSITPGAGNAILLNPNLRLNTLQELSNLTQYYSYYY